MDIFNIMAKCGVPHQAAMNVMSEMHGGRHNMNFIEKDVRNRYISKILKQKSYKLYYP